MSALNLGPGISLPIEAVTETFGIFANRGKGKSYTLRVMIEELFAAHVDVAVLDVKGDHYGVRTSADGKGPGLPFVIFGGEHADVPLEPTAGALLADLIVDQRVPSVLDLSGMSKTKARSFTVDFAERLYRRNRDPLHLIVDEADVLIPQRATAETARLLGAMEDIAKRGRSRGLGLTVVSQRPQEVAKSVTDLCETLILLGMTGPRSLRAIEDWISVNVDETTAASEVMASLPSLEVGEAWVWSPGFLRLLKRTRIRSIRTFDSHATPRAGVRLVAPKGRAEVDLAALGERIAATVEKAKADDPRELRKRIRDLEATIKDQTVRLDFLEQEVTDRTQELSERPAEQVKVEVEVAVLDESLVERIEKAAHPLVALAREAREAVAVWSDQKREEVQSILPTAPVVPLRSVPAPVRSAPVARREPSGDSDVQVGKGERIILTAIAQYPQGATREQLTILTGYKRSTRDAYIQRLRTSALVEQSGDRIVATQAGVDALGSDCEPLPTGAALRAHWLARLPEGERAILAQLIDAYPSGVNRDSLSETTGYKRSTRDAYIQRLRSRQLATTNGEPRAADDLFDGG